LDMAAHGRREPCKEIDEVWHEFILHTVLYRRYCETRYGRIVEHVPTSPILLSGDDSDWITNGDEGRECSSDCRSEANPGRD
jgi:hypothetical protein